MDTQLHNPLENEESHGGLPPALFSLTKRDTAFVICALAASVFLSLFGIFGGFALGYLLSVVMLFILFAVYFAKSGRVRFFPAVCGLLSLANGAIFLCTTNGGVRFFGVITGLLLSLVCFDGFVNGTSVGNRQTLGVFYSAVSTFGNTVPAVKALFTNGKGDKKQIGKALVGLLCAIPVLIVIVPLLLSSDDAFRGMMSDIFDNTFTTLMKTVFGVLICPFIIAYGFSLKSGRVAKMKKGSFSGVENIYLISFLSAISACYLLYLFSQLAYFFSAFQGFLPDGEITYAAYARKGFFEMCVIAVINLVIVFGALLLSKKENGKVCHGIKTIATFISAFTLIIIATAISKMVLYIDAYGMTVLRVTTSAFMLFLSIVFISVILWIYFKKINVIKTALLAASGILMILGTVNVNAVCARYNYESYKSKKLDTIDVQQLYELGYEGIPYVVKLASDKQFDVSYEAKSCLAEAYLYDYFDDMAQVKGFTVDDLKKNQKAGGFERFSIPKAAAYDSLYDYIESHPGFGTVCQAYFEETEAVYY